jgi:hypothetical protein
MKRRALILGGVAALTGCGGGGSQVSFKPGRAVFTIKWLQTTTRLIPVLSRSIVIELRQGSVVVARQIIPKDVTRASFESLPEGDLTVLATAHPNSDGTGVAQASGIAPLTITDGQTTQASLTMDSTITSFTVAPATLGVGETRRILASARDAAGSIVLILHTLLQYEVVAGGSNITWDSVWLNATGRATGQVTFRITYQESGVSGTATLEIGPTAPPRPASVVFPVRGVVVADAPHHALLQAFNLVSMATYYISIIDPDTGIEIRKLSDFYVPPLNGASSGIPVIQSMALSADAKRLYFTNSDGVYVINTELPPPVSRLRVSNLGNTRVLSVLPDSAYSPVIALPDPNMALGNCAVLNTSGVALPGQIPSNTLVVSHSGNRAYNLHPTATPAQQVYTVDGVSGFTLRTSASVNPITYARDGYAYGDSNNPLGRKIYDAETLSEVGSLGPTNEPRFTGSYIGNSIDEFVYSLLSPAPNHRIIKQSGVPLQVLSVVECPVPDILMSGFYSLGQDRVVLIDGRTPTNLRCIVCNGS